MLKYIAALVAVLVCFNLSASELVRYRDLCKATGAIVWILKDQGARPTDYRLQFADGFAWAIVPAAKKYGVDIDAMIVTAFTESSFHADAVGEKGERGLYQIHRRPLRDWKDIRENADKGARLLARAIRTCSDKGGTWEHVFGHYRSGRCDPEFGKWKARLYRRLKKELRKAESLPARL
ncbi:MAG: transglycosylase SLT domain-containing protein [Nitrospinaceae bacterium]|nr:lytic transglycosylase domain-containing protein [Deltaproteobacteria bacterium]NIY14201.1 transglycosylase SLT domain-containing protein [Nitrospinaceae bacterium]